MIKRLNILFYTFLAIFALTALVTLLGVIGVLHIPASHLNKLLIAFVIELAGAVIAIYRNAPFFGGSSDPVTSIANSVSVIDDVADELEAVVTGRMQADVNKQYGIVVRRERGELVAYQRQQVIHRSDFQKLPADQLDALERYERSMLRFHKQWGAMWDKRSAATTAKEREQIEADIRRLVTGMKEDLHGILDFLARQGMVLQDHYKGIRKLVDDLVAGGKRQDYTSVSSSGV